MFSIYKVLSMKFMFLLLFLFSIVHIAYAESTRHSMQTNLNFYKRMTLEELEERIQSGDVEAQKFLDNCNKYGIVLPINAEKSSQVSTVQSQSFTSKNSEDFYKNMPLQELEQRANAGEAEAQCELGILYDEGKNGVEQNYLKAKHYYELAVAQNHAKAQFRLARMYSFPRGLEQDYKKALHYYTLSAEQGFATAQYNLALMYDHAKGVEQDYKKALHYYTLSAEQGDAKAQYNLALMYYNGEGIKKDYKKALHYYELAANQGSAKAQYNLALMYDYGEGIKKDYKKAFHYYELAASQGDADAQYNLGFMYYNGEGVKKDYKKAFYYYELAANQGNTMAYHNLGLMYFFGDGVSIDYEKAREYFEIGTKGDSIKPWIMLYVSEIYVFTFNCLAFLFF